MCSIVIRIGRQMPQAEIDECRTLLRRCGMNSHRSFQRQVVTRRPIIACMFGKSTGLIGIAGGIGYGFGRTRAIRWPDNEEYVGLSHYPFQLYWLAVAAAERGKGLSRQLLQELIGTIGPQGMRAVFPADNVDCARSLVSVGFRRAGAPFRSGMRNVQLYLRNGDGSDPVPLSTLEEWCASGLRVVS